MTKAPPYPPMATARSVLVIEDHADGREMLRQLLVLLGHRAVVAADGHEGVQKALTEQPDVALVDIGLPLMDGYQVARQIRASLGEGVFLIAHTAYNTPEHQQRAREAGFNVFLAKPLDPAILSAYLDFMDGPFVPGRR